ncbi:hypothetical protein B0H63DRAFT_458352 [Podospora didyma]|uniref:Uncharacterized protein n=1 Tax=Podospora didyma TaxID=330526 RepID=A0AAE0P596_9PEZI|nr:hypothetical protein B0H63DRAFT_458352 [Podospora didyma]
MAPISVYVCAKLATSDVGRYVPEAELVVVVGTLLPFLAYPFLPQKKDPTEVGNAWEPLLQICSLIQLFFVHGINFFILFIRLISNLECNEYPEFLPNYTISLYGSFTFT